MRKNMHKRMSLLAAAGLLAGLVGVTAPGSACSPPAYCEFVEDVRDTTGGAVDAVTGLTDNPPVVRTPLGPVCAGCVVKALTSAISVVRIPGAGLKAPSKFTYVSAPNGKVNTWTSPGASSAAAASAAASTSACADGISCTNAEYRADAPVSVEDANVRLYGVITLIQPDFYTGNSYFGMIYMRSASTAKNSRAEIRTLLDRVAEVQAPSSFITDWSPEGSNNWGDPHNYSLQIGGEYKGIGFNIGGSWTSWPGRIEGQAPANGGKVFIGSWSGKLKNGTAPFRGAALYRITAGEPSWYEYYLETSYRI